MHRLARNDAGRLHVDAHALVGLDRALAVDRIAERIDHAAEQALADRHVHDRAGALDGLAFLDLAVVAEDHDADVVGFEIERHAAHAVLELDHLAGLHVVEAVDARDAVTDREHLTDFRDLGLLAEILDLLFQDGGNFCGADVHQRASFIAILIEFSLVRSDASTMREPSFTFSPPMIEGSTCDVDPHVLAGDLLERVADFGHARVIEPLGDGDLGGHLALVLGDERVEAADDLAHREQAAVRRHHAQEIRSDPLDAGLVEDRGKRLGLVVCGKHRRAHQARQVGIGRDETVKRLEIGLHLIDGAGLARQLEQSRRIAPRHAGNDAAFACHALARRLFL